ncbi:MAG: restriction endonuclease [Bacteroidetes bacterium]|nr:MAG: restriction endonuclease [Bacteroidota bacterium]
MTSRKELILSYLNDIKSANKELIKKEHFKDLLNKLYSENDEILKIINKISKGAETTILNIPRKDKLHRGSADTLYNKIIIEFENDLKTSLNHAKEQLAGYLLGKFNSGEGYNFTLIASDFINWKIYSPDVSCLEKLDSIKEDELILNEISSVSFTLNENNTDDFYFWLDRFLFKTERIKATLKSVEEAFGHHSNVFIECFRELKKWYNNAKKFGEVQVAFDEWSKFLSIAYGSYEATDENFMIHTYLSVFSKMLAYSIITNDEFINDDEMKDIISGQIFNNNNINNFVENDFFYWVKNERIFKNLKKVFRIIAQEISAYDFKNVDEDVMKGVYQELIDLDTRHTLGEYYTPDWLCERIVNEFNFKNDDKILDPACGSGSFLRAAIHRMKLLYPAKPIDELCNQIYGIDIHPLSVQISKTTVLIALSEELLKNKQPIHLNIILANTLLAPDGVKDLFGGQFSLTIDKEQYKLNTQILDDVSLFDEALDICEKVAEQTLGRKQETKEEFEKTLKKIYINGGLTQQVIESYYTIYLAFKKVKESGRNSIWKFIIQNLYKPYFLAGKFDYVIGNPPWFTYSSIKNEEYQDILKQIAEKYRVKPEKVANFPHLEIAVIFLAYCCNYFLKDNGKLGFVLPRSILNADQHDNTRSGKAQGFRLINIWDLMDVTPLFNIPCCVMFAIKVKNNRELPATGLDGLSINGKLKEHNCHLPVAKKFLKEEKLKWFVVQHGLTSALSTTRKKKQNKINLYKKKFKQGATIVPRTFYFVELDQKKPLDLIDRIVNLKTAESIIPDTKEPWKKYHMKGRIDSRFLFRTVLSKSILPFSIYNPDMIVLPIFINKDENNRKTIDIKSYEEIRREGYIYTSDWFFKVNNYWEQLKTEKSKKMSHINRLDYHKGLTNQNLNLPYLVLYNASAKDANAVVVKRKDFDLEFIVESKAYWFGTTKIKEANYLTSILNSSVLNSLIKDFQTRGLFGPRDVHKKILDIYFPEFDNTNKKHLRLAELGEKAHKKSEKYLKDNPPKQELTTFHLGRIRLTIKNHLKSELDEIDKIVMDIIK